MKADRAAKKALQGGREQAKRVLALRMRVSARRASKLKAAHKAALRAARGRGAPEPASLVPAGLATSPLGVLVAEGDSWFDYPWTDVLEELEDEHLYDVESVAHHGDRVEDMAYSEGQLEKLVRVIERVARSGRRPRAILLSGGGNDIAGVDEFAMLLNHAASPTPGLNESVVAGVIDERLRHLIRRGGDHQAYLRYPVREVSHRLSFRLAADYSSVISITMESACHAYGARPKTLRGRNGNLIRSAVC